MMQASHVSIAWSLTTQSHSRSHSRVQPQAAAQHRQSKSITKSTVNAVKTIGIGTSTRGDDDADADADADEAGREFTIKVSSVKVKMGNNIHVIPLETDRRKNSSENGIVER